MNTVGKVMELLTRALKLGVAVFVACVHTEHANEHLLEHG